NGAFDGANLDAIKESWGISYGAESNIELVDGALKVTSKTVLDEEGKVTGVELQRMELGEPDASGRRRPKPVEGSNFIQETDLAIVALGTRSNPLMLDCTPGLKLTDRNYIAVDENGETSIPNVYAGGDIVTGAATVILAMGAGRRAAQSIAKKMGLE
ncbi:MAG: FAD-dependent oxidoreductase, partial [Mailhella sp.]|nr:FAD-dependent oxidoreductase [Mailhella sp.]